MKMYFKILIAVNIMILGCFQVKAQSPSSLDTAVAKFQRLYNSQQNDSIFYMFSPRIQSLMSLSKTTEMMGQLYKQMGALQSVKFERRQDKVTYYQSVFKNMELMLMASIDQDGKLDAFRFVPADNKKEHPEKKPAAPMKGALDVVLETSSGGIFGTLTVPEGSLKVPVVLIIAGSGPTDRDGNNPLGVNCNAYRMLADSLQKAGIACVRYDKRGIGQSADAIKDELSVSFDSMINDAVGYIKMLKGDSRFSDVIVLGHSEGSLIGMVAAQKADVKKFISVAGAGETADKIIKTQLALQSEALAAKGAIIMDSIKKGYEATAIDSSLMLLFRPSVQPYLRSWLRYSPQAELKKVKVPILILQGENDLQVALLQAQMLKKAAPQATLITFKKMNHILKDAPAERQQNLETYTDGDLPLTSGLASAIVAFIRK